MHPIWSAPKRRSVLAIVAARGPVGVAMLAAVPSRQIAEPPSMKAAASTREKANRPFGVSVPEAELADLRRPIGGPDTYFVHVRARHPKGMLLIMTHGWPGSIFELLNVIGPVMDPPAHGGRTEDTFDLVFALAAWVWFLGQTAWYLLEPQPHRAGLGRVDGPPWRRALCARGGRWEAIVSEAMALQEPYALPVPEYTGAFVAVLLFATEIRTAVRTAEDSITSTSTPEMERNHDDKQA